MRNATTRRPQAEFDLANAKVQLEQNLLKEAMYERNTDYRMISAEEESIEGKKTRRNIGDDSIKGFISRI